MLTRLTVASMVSLLGSVGCGAHSTARPDIPTSFNSNLPSTRKTRTPPGPRPQPRRLKLDDGRLFLTETQFASGHVATHLTTATSEVRRDNKSCLPCPRPCKTDASCVEQQPMPRQRTSISVPRKRRLVGTPLVDHGGNNQCCCCCSVPSPMEDLTVRGSGIRRTP